MLGIALCGAPLAVGQEQAREADLDVQCAAALLLRGDADVADIVADRFIKSAPDQPTRAARQRQLSLMYTGSADRQIQVRLSPEEELTLRSGIIDRAARLLEEAGKADPKVARSVDFQTELAMLIQRRAQVIAASLPRLKDPAKAADSRKEAEKLFADALNRYTQLAKEQEKIVKALEDKPIPTEPEARKIQEQKLDEEDGIWGALRLRIAVLKYNVSLLEGQGGKPSDKKLKQLKELDKEFGELAYRYDYYQFIVHIYYYWGLTAIEMGATDKAIEHLTKGIKTDDLPETLDMRLSCYEGLVKADMAKGEFGEAVKTINGLLTAKPNLPGRDRFLLARIEANAQWAMHLAGMDDTKAAGDKFGKAMEDAREMQSGPLKTKAMKGIAEAARAGGGAFELDPAVLEVVADSARHDEEWQEAADIYRQITTLGKVSRDLRDKAAYFLAYCYLKADRPLEAALAGSWGADTTSTTSATTDWRAQCDQLAISAFSTLAKSPNPQEAEFYNKMLINERLRSQARGIQRQGSPQYDLAQQLEQASDFVKAIVEYSKIKPGEPAYDKALFRLGECQWKYVRQLKEKKSALVAKNISVARDYYTAAIEYCKKEPGADAAEKQLRKELTGKSLYRLAYTEADPATREFARGRIERASGLDVHKKLQDIVTETAQLLHQPTPEGLDKIATRADAATAVEKMWVTSQQRSIVLTDGFADTYPTLGEFLPLVHFLRLQCFARIEKFEEAEKELETLQEDYPDFDLSIALDIMARIFNRLGDQYLKAKDEASRKEGDEYKGKALSAVLRRVEANADQPFEVYQFLSALAYRYCTPEQRDAAGSAIQKALEKFPETKDNAEALRDMRYVAAKLLLESGRAADAKKIYQLLEAYYEDSKATEKDPGPRMAVRRGLADAYKATGDYEKAVEYYRSFDRLLPGSPEWWDVIYNLCDAYVSWQKYPEAYDLVSSIQKVRPSMGGDELRQKFIGSLQQVDEKAKDPDVKGKAKALLEEMRKYKSEAEKPK